MNSTARILPYPHRLYPTPEQRLRSFINEFAREMGADVTAKMLLREGYRLMRPQADEAETVPA